MKIIDYSIVIAIAINYSVTAVDTIMLSTVKQKYMYKISNIYSHKCNNAFIQRKSRKKKFYKFL